MMTGQAIEKLAEEAAQQKADGGSIDSSETRCPSCGEKGVMVSERRLADGGPLLLDGWTVHKHDGDVHYHSG